MIERPLTSHDICAVIVTYNPDDALPHRVTCIADQVGGVVIVDNHSDTSALSMMHRLTPTINLIANSVNLGVATALNQGVCWAHQHGHKFALLLDQDSEPMDSMVETLVKIYNGFVPKDKLAMVAANSYNKESHRIDIEVPAQNGEDWGEVKQAITSGSLIRLQAFRDVGPFRDDFFIDGVDFEYCLRARRKGYKIILSVEPLMYHSAGIPQKHTLMGKTVWTLNHNATRCYYITRNYIVLLREYFFRDPKWIILYSWSTLKWFAKLCFFETDRIHKLGQVFIGIGHGFVGRSKHTLEHKKQFYSFE
ncbi:MAG: glycosyltransferase family 2 protein [Anaerolineae bacterium]|nr:glycosyltransferase family 2 protein [Anaerolineae bacterium]